MYGRYRTRTSVLRAPALLLLLPVVGAFSGAEILNEPPWAADLQQPRPRRAGESQSLEQEVAVLTSRVGDALASEQHLEATNAQLRQEVEGWVKVGTQVMKREAQIVNAIKQSKNGDQESLRAAIISGLAVPESGQKPPLALTGRSTDVREAAPAEHLPHVLVSWHLFVMAFTVLAAVAFCLLRGRASLSSLLRNEKFLELSELQLEGVPSGFGEGYLVMHPSGGVKTRTQAAEQIEDSSILRFPEVLTMTMRKNDGPCVITIYRRGEMEDTRVGKATLEASQLLGNGSEVPCQYFRFKVNSEVPSRQQLHVAMRIRAEPAVRKAALSTRSKNPAFSV